MFRACKEERPVHPLVPRPTTVVLPYACAKLRDVKKVPNQANKIQANGRLFVDEALNVCTRRPRRAGASLVIVYSGDVLSCLGRRRGLVVVRRGGGQPPCFSFWQKKKKKKTALSVKEYSPPRQRGSF